MVSPAMRIAASCVVFAAGSMVVTFASYREDLGDFLMVVGGAMLLADWAPSWLADRMRRRREPGLCAKCGYNLTGNTSGVCPECGTPVKPDSEVR